MGETKVIVQRRTTVKTIVRARATKNDLQAPDNRFLVPQNGGHAVARFSAAMSLSNVYPFELTSGDIAEFQTLDNIWLL